MMWVVAGFFLFAFVVAAGIWYNNYLVAKEEGKKDYFLGKE